LGWPTASILYITPRLLYKIQSSGQASQASQQFWPNKPSKQAQGVKNYKPAS